MEKKIDTIKKALSCDNYKLALKTAKGFWFGLSKEQKAVISRGYECTVRPDFYAALGYKPPQCIKAGVACLRTVYNL